MNLCLSLLVCLIALTATKAFATGVYRYDASARSSSMAGTGVADGHGSQGLALNPASLGFEDGLTAELGVALSLQPQELSTRLPAASVRSRLVPAVSGQIFATVPVDKFVIGVGLFVPVQDEAYWPSALVADSASASHSLFGLHFATAVAAAPNEHLSVGAGVTVAHYIQKFEGTFANSVFKFNGTGWSALAHVGLSTEWWASRLRLALTYRTAMDVSLLGLAQVGTVQTSARTSFRLPHDIALGAYVLLGSVVALTLDAHLILNSAQSTQKFTSLHGPLSAALDSDGQTALATRLGTEFLISKRFSLRAGAGFDTSSTRALSTTAWPTGNTVIASAGFGLIWGNFEGDLAYTFQYTLPLSMRTVPPVVRLSTEHRVSITVRFRQ